MTRLYDIIAGRLEPSTLAQYSRAVGRLLRFSESLGATGGRRPRGIAALLAGPATGPPGPPPPAWPPDQFALALFVADLIDRPGRPLAAASIDKLLYGVQAAMREDGYAPFMGRDTYPLLDLARAGAAAITRRRRSRLSRPFILSPLAVALVCRRLRAVPNAMVRSVGHIITIAHAGLLRQIEYSAPGYGARALRRSDVTFSPNDAALAFRQGKCGPFTATFSCIGGEDCAHCAVGELLRLPGRPDSLLFRTGPGLSLYRTDLIKIMNGILTSLGILPDGARFTGHSLRRGAATALLLGGVPLHAVQRIGRWQSDAFVQYIHAPPAVAAHAHAILAGRGPDPWAAAAWQRVW